MYSKEDSEYLAKLGIALPGLEAIKCKGNACGCVSAKLSGDRGKTVLRIRNSCDKDVEVEINWMNLFQAERFTTIEVWSGEIETVQVPTDGPTVWGVHKIKAKKI